MPISTITTSNTMNEWRVLINSAIAQLNDIGVYDNVNIAGGSIDNTEIGTITPSVGTFTNLIVTSTLNLAGTSIVLDNNSISGDKISGGTIDNVIVELSAAPTLGIHATNKTYVDSQVASVLEESLIYSIIFGS